ncbi:hypothetical protein [Rhodococcus sp. ACT016]|uniref:hypothetical protein n=1 Tax=Rhodococcus sp. ACT016 TaxID=3134808 RepID=UPI003D2BBADB
MGHDDHDLLAFAARWAPFGGPPAEDTFVRFGMTLPRFRIRVQEAAARLRSKRAEQRIRRGGSSGNAPIPL